MKHFGAVCLLLAVTGCASRGDPDAAWARIDGEPMASAISQRQLETAQAVCTSKEQESAVPRVPIELALTGVVGTAVIEHDRHQKLQDLTTWCMASRGYVFGKPRSTQHLSHAPPESQASGAIYNVPLAPKY
jgi:hypothetical protein